MSLRALASAAAIAAALALSPSVAFSSVEFSRESTANVVTNASAYVALTNRSEPTLCSSGTDSDPLLDLTHKMNDDVSLFWNFTDDSDRFRAFGAWDRSSTDRLDSDETGTVDVEKDQATVETGEYTVDVTMTANPQSAQNVFETTLTTTITVVTAGC